RVAFVADAINVNSESIVLRRCVNFLMRQLLCVRLQVAQWPLLLAANIGHNLALITTVVWLAAGLISQNWTQAAFAGGLFGFYLGGLVVALGAGEVLIRRIVGTRRTDLPAPVFSWKTIPALLLTQFLAFYLLVSTVFVRRIDWRGITYVI